MQVMLVVQRRRRRGAFFVERRCQIQDDGLAALAAQQNLRHRIASFGAVHNVNQTPSAA